MKSIRSIYLRLVLAVTLVTGALAPIALAQPVDGPAVTHVVEATQPVVVAPQVVVEAPPVTSWNPADWFADAAVLGGVIAALVALLKTNFLKNLHGLGTVALSFGLGIALSLLGTVTWPGLGRLNELTGMAALMFGVNASVIASGGWDLIRGLIMAAFGGKSRGATEAST